MIKEVERSNRGNSRKKEKRKVGVIKQKMRKNEKNKIKKSLHYL